MNNSNSKLRKISKTLKKICKRSLQTKTVKNIYKSTCKPFNKKEKAACVQSFKKDFIKSCTLKN